MKAKLLVILAAILMLFGVSASAEDIVEFDYIPEGHILQEGGFIDTQTRADALVEMSVSS